jgi:hypothetical protein
MIFLSKNGKDEYVNMLAKGSNATITSTEDFDFSDSSDPIVLRGIMKHKIMKQCWESGRNFYYIDTGYFGNEPSKHNPQGWKYWHRIVKNDLQHTKIVDRPDDRFRRFNKQFTPWKKNGRKILIATPDEKPCKFYGVDHESWIDKTVSEIQKHTDRPIEIRQRSKSRKTRILDDTLEQALQNDVFNDEAFRFLWKHFM